MDDRCSKPKMDTFFIRNFNHTIRVQHQDITGGYCFFY